MKNIHTFFLTLLCFFSLFMPASGNAEGTIIELNKKTYQELVQGSKPFIIDVYADWCGPCKRFHPVFEEASKENNQYQFAQLNGDSEDVLRDELHVTAYPTVLFFKDGKIVGKVEGAMNKEELQENINKYIK